MAATSLRAFLPRRAGPLTAHKRSSRAPTRDALAPLAQQTRRSPSLAQITRAAVNFSGRGRRGQVVIGADRRRDGRHASAVVQRLRVAVRRQRSPRSSTPRPVTRVCCTTIQVHSWHDDIAPAPFHAVRQPARRSVKKVTYRAESSADPCVYNIWMVAVRSAAPSKALGHWHHAAYRFWSCRNDGTVSPGNI